MRLAGGELGQGGVRGCAALCRPRRTVLRSQQHLGNPRSSAPVIRATLPRRKGAIWVAMLRGFGAGAGSWGGPQARRQQQRCTPARA